MDCIKWYEIIPQGSYRVWRNCSGCGKKTWYQNTNCFRINANGTKLDVWLIYQCEICRHTYNLTIWERVKVSAIGAEYERYQKSDQKLAEKYGNDRAFFERNRAEIDEKRDYKIKERREAPKEVSGKSEEEGGQEEKGVTMFLYNPNYLHLRIDKERGEIFGKSRSWIQKARREGTIAVTGTYLGKVTTVLVS